MISILFPYDILSESDPTLMISGVRLDGVSKANHIKKEEMTLPLYEVSQSWHRAEIDLELTCAPQVVREFENTHGRVSAVVVANCLPTNFRHPLRLQRSEVEPGRWSGVLELHRDNIRDRVALVTTLTATVAEVAHRPVASASGWTLYADEPESLRLKGTLNVRWKNFKTTTDQPACDFPNSSHVVAFSGGVPELWLNSGFDGLMSLLKDRKDRRGADKGLHDFQRTGIARSVWMALIADSLAAVRGGEVEEGLSEPDWPELAWQTEILKLILPEVAPGKSERELLSMAVGDWRKHPGTAEFFARTEAIVGDIVKSNESLRRFVQSYRGEET